MATAQPVTPATIAAARSPTGTGKAETAQMLAVRRCGGDDRRGIGADREEAGDAGIEEAAHAPLDVQGKTEDRIDAAGDEEADEIEGEAGQFHQSSLPLKRPCGLKISNATMMKKATAVL